MKKIIATVLAMVMALALCSTAFAATVVTGQASLDTKTNVYTGGTVTATFHAATAAKLNKDGKQINPANVAYYVVGDTDYVAVSSLAEADLVIYNNWNSETQEASNVLLYLAKAVVKYNGTGTVFTNFGEDCGQVILSSYDKDETYYTTNEKGNKSIYVADDEGNIALMVGGKLVNVKDTGVTTETIVKHAAVPTVDKATGKVTGYTCSVCKLAAVKAPNKASIPTGAQTIDGTNYYFPVAASTTTTTTSSPKTFDAGIAMYVGMALTSVAGSAVVIGKKKEF